MRLKKVLIVPLLLMSLILVFLAQEQQQDAFYETVFDGVWTGYVRLNTAQGKWDFPMVLNLNIYADSGIGFSFLSDNLQTAPTGFKLYNLQNIQMRGKKITVQIDTALPLLTNKVEEAYIHTIKLSYKNATDTLKGNFTSSDPDLGRGTVLLFREDSSKEIQKVWAGTVTIDKTKTPLIMQLVQTEVDNNLPKKAQASDINGVGFIGDDFGPLTEGKFDKSKLTGTLNLTGESVDLNLKLAKRKLKGRLDGQTFSSKTKLIAAGTKGKAISFTNVSQTELNIGESNDITLNGRNLSAGVLVHLNSSQVQVDSVEFLSKKSIQLSITPSASVPEDQKISLRIINPDGQIVDRADIFTAKKKEEPPTISFSQDIQPVFSQNCALSGCHTGSFPSQGLNLSSGQAYGNIVNVPSSQMPSLNRITPFNPDDSYLIRKIKGQGITGSRMPLNRQPLDSETITKFETWVTEGSKDN